jgi:hypothetical protein
MIQTDYRGRVYIAFGRHDGTPLMDVPTNYLRWALGNVDALTRDECRLIERELRRRGAEGDARNEQHRSAPAHPPMLATSLRPLAIEIVQAGRRALALKNHPDLGGDGTRMRDINAAADALALALEGSR